MQHGIDSGVDDHWNMMWDGHVLDDDDDGWWGDVMAASFRRSLE